MLDCIWKMTELCDSEDPDCICKDYRTTGSKTGQHMIKTHPKRFKKIPVYIEAVDESNGVDATVKTRAILFDGKIGVIDSIVIKTNEAEEDG